jgi:hypothetical protein
VRGGSWDGEKLFLVNLPARIIVILFNQQPKVWKYAKFVLAHQISEYIHASTNHVRGWRTSVNLDERGSNTVS